MDPLLSFFLNSFMAKLNSLSSGFYLGFILFDISDFLSRWPFPSFLISLQYPQAYSWFSSYFYGHFFRTSFADLSSSAFPWNIDVPQYSVLGRSFLLTHLHFLVDLIYSDHLTNACLVCWWFPNMRFLARTFQSEFPTVY